MLENLWSKTDIIPKDFKEDTEEEYFSLLKSQDLGKLLTNMSEYLLETEMSTGKVSTLPLMNTDSSNYSTRPSGSA